MIFFLVFANTIFIVVVDFNNFAIAFFKLYKNLGQKTRENETIFSDLFDFGAASVVVVVVVHFTHAFYIVKNNK